MQITLTFPKLETDPELPPLWRVRQRWPAGGELDVAAATHAELEALGLRAQLRPGMRIALTAGSRGIRDVVTVLRATADWLRGAGCEPFVVPAMGSHGGATAAGQVRLLADLGISEASIGCPIEATMEVVELGRLASGTPAYMDRLAAAADGVLAINRVKAHTSFKAAIESGLAKMCAVGLGKRQGAEMVHSRGNESLRTLMLPLARLVVERGKVLAGLAILEDAHEQTAAVVGLSPEQIGGPGEAALLERSKELMARLPFAHLDVLVVDEIGKNISGTGMDTNVIGRLRIEGEPEPATPQINVIVALDLSAASHGNATGMGLADLVTAQLVQKVDFAATYMNNLTAGLIGLRKGALPIVSPTPQAAVATALRVCGQPDPAAVRLARIKNTLDLEELLVSQALLVEVADNAALELVGPAGWGDMAG